MKITVNLIILVALFIWLITIISVLKTTQVEILKEVSVVVSNLISGWLGYLVRQLED
jgi:hypothetical protein